MATEHIYTVSSLDDEPCDGISRCVAGSYRTFDRAVEECAKYILERANIRDDIAYSMANDENHEEAKAFFDVDENGFGATVRDEAGLMAYLRDVLEVTSVYYVWDGHDSYHFDIDENDLVG